MLVSISNTIGNKAVCNILTKSERTLKYFIVIGFKCFYGKIIIMLNIEIEDDFNEVS